MPKDPVVAINQQANEYQTVDRAAMIEAFQHVMNNEPDFIATHPTAEVNKRILYEANKRVAATGVEPPKTLGNMPGLGPKQVLELPQRALGSFLGMTPPDSPARPKSTWDVLGVQPLADIATGNSPDLQDVGGMVEGYLPAILAAIPQFKGAKGLLGLGKYLESYLGAVGGAALAGGGAALLDKAAEYQRANESPVDALIHASDTTALGDVVMRGLSNALFEQLTAVPTVMNTGVREAVMRDFAGVGSEQVDQWLKDATHFKIDLSLQNVSTSEIIRRMPQSVGRFPRLNKPFVENIERPGAQIRDAFSDMMYGVAPVMRELTEGGPVQQSDKALKIALQTLNGAERSFSLAQAKHARLYDDFYKMAKDTGTVVRPVNGEITAAVQRQRLNAAIRKEEYVPQLNKDGSQMSTLSGRLLGKIVRSDRRPKGNIARANKALDDLLDSPEKYPSVENFQGTVRRLQSTVDELGADTQAGAALIDVINALRKDFEENLVGPPQVKAAKQAADSYFKESVAIFGGRIGNLIRQIDMEFGTKRLADPLTGAKIGLGDRAGSKDPMAVIDVLFDDGGNDTVQDLYRMFTREMGSEGDRLFREAYGLHLSRAIAGSTKRAGPTGLPMTDTKALRKAMGIDDTKSPRFGATVKALELSGINPVDFMKMLDLSDQVFQFGVPDVSQLITRRMMLGGFGSGARTMVPMKGLLGADKNSNVAHAALDALASSAAFFYLASNQVKKLTDPAILKNYVRLLDPAAPLAVRMRSARRLALLDTGFLVWGNLQGSHPTPIGPGDSRAPVTAPLPGAGGAIQVPQNLPPGVR